MSKYLEPICRHRWRTLFGRPIEQSFAAIYILEQMLSQHKPDCIVELGTGKGILSTYFSIYISYNGGGFLTYDVNEPLFDIFEFKKGNVYDEAVMKSCIKFLNSYDRPFLFCDALDPKSDLVNLYSPHLKTGTVIAAHDAILTGNNNFRWGFTEDKINWDKMIRLEPYYEMSKELDTRTLFLITI